MQFAKSLAALVLSLLLVACSTTQQNIQTAADSNVLRYTVGKPYAEIAAQKALDDFLLQNKAYGELVSQSPINGGDTLYRHAKLVEASQSGVDFGIFGGSKKQINYSLFYFRVGADGNIKDYANGVVPGNEISCISYVGGLFQNCDNTQQVSNDVARLDASVRTSSGQALANWQ